MKKVRKEKKNKVEKKSKMNGWLTALTVFAGVTAVSGATVLGVYLTGGFDEKVVLPESIAFEYNLDNFKNNQLEIGVAEPFNSSAPQTFKLKITSPTEGVTRNKVTLSFAGQEGYNTPDSMGYISNTVIRLPKTVSLNEEFEVELLTEDLKESETSSDYVLDENGEFIDWIKGGISTIQAHSADNQQSPISLKIAVDVPVYRTETQIINSNGQIVDSVVTNESFTVKSKFIPSKSEYMFSDDKSGLAEENWRVKRSFFEGRNTTAITPVYDDKYNVHFVVGDEPVSALEINAYTYQTAYSQLNFEKTLSDDTPTNYYISMLENVARTLSSDQVATKTISISKANVGNYTISKQSQTIKMEVGKNLRLYMNRFDFFANNDYIGADIYSTSGQLLDGMLGNIGIAFVVNGDSDATIGANAAISVVGGENASSYVVIDGVRYYKPTLAGSNPRFSFWDLTGVEAKALTIKTVLLIEEEPEVVAFEIADEVVSYSINLEITQHIEKPLAWTDDSNIEIMLEYDSDGKVISHTINNLSSLVSVPSTNIYQDIVFFACFGGQDKSEYREMADKVLGASGYDYDRSGYYATESGNLTMFAIEGDNLTIYETGDFTLYFATVLVENGQYKLDQNGLYQIVLLSPSAIRVSSHKALNEKSVSHGEILTDEFTADDDVVNINLGNEKTITASFTINKESVPVFQNENRKGFMSPVILDEFNNDRTDLFLVDSESFEIDAETGNGILQYKLKVKSAVKIDNDNGIFLGFVSLQYNNREDKNINWIYQLNAMQTICIYSPVSRLIEINTDGGYLYKNLVEGKSEVIVEQSLQNNGEFKTEITAKTDGNISQTFTNNSIEQFLTSIIGAGGARIVITDQKGKTETLSGKWTFKISEGDANVINISSDGKSFVFKNTNNESASVTLIISSADNEVATGIIKFNIQSVGISEMSYSNSVKVYETESYTDKTTDISSAVVTKYGAKSTMDGSGNATQFVVLSDLVKFYLKDGTEYNNFAFRFSPQFLSESSLPEGMPTALFGEDGMIALYSDDTTIINFGNDYAEQNIRNTLYSTPIYKVAFTKNFAVGAVLQFTVSDTNGAVNTSFDLNIISNISVSSENYPVGEGELYAQQKIKIENNVIKNNEAESELEIRDLYTEGKTYYAVLDGENYILVDIEPATYVAEFVDGEIKFNDFWTEEEREFNVYFQPEGNNYYALNHGITFKVKRDLNIVDKRGVFYLVGSKNYVINDFVEITRKDGRVITELENSLSFSFTEYLNYDKTSGNINKLDDAEFFFDYNVKTLKTNLTINLLDIQLANLNVDIELYETAKGSIYKEIASNLSPNVTGFVASAQTQTVDAVEYIMIDVSTSSDWGLKSIGSAIYTPFHLDYHGNNMNSVFDTVGQSKISISFKNQDSLLAGLDNEKIYFVVYVFAQHNTSKALATLHIPLILSKIGYESVVYEDGEKEIAPDRKLETALTRPEQLIKDGIYNEITAGKLTQILKQYDYSELVVEGMDPYGTPTYSMKDKGIEVGGLYTLSGFLHTINYYPLDSAKYDNYPEIVKNILTNKDENGSFGNLTLNHLAKNIGSVYLALEYRIEKSDAGQTQSFYYLLKVNPDIVVEDVVYAYDGNGEYVTESKPINLEQLFDDYTLHEGEKRFNISKDISIVNPSTDKFEVKVNSASAKLQFIYRGNQTPDIQPKTFNSDTTLNLAEIFDSSMMRAGEIINVLILEGDAQVLFNNETVFRTLKFKNEIESVQIGDENPLTNKELWEEYISLQFSADYSTLEFKFNKELTDKLEVVVKHSYQGSANENDLAVVGGEQYYKLVFNGASTNYKVIFEDYDTEDKKDLIVVEDDECVVSINNYDYEEYKIIILLKSFEDTGIDNQVGTTIKGLLNAEVINADYEDVIEYYNYDNVTGVFTITLKEYLSEDKTVQFALYIEQGYLARLTFNIKANAMHKAGNTESGKFVEEKPTLVAGVLNPFDKHIQIYLNGNSTPVTLIGLTTTAQGGDYKVKSATLHHESGNNKYAYWYDGSSGIGLVTAALINDQSVTFTFEIEFFENKDGTVVSAGIYKFTQSFTISGAIIPNDNYTDMVSTIAGGKHTITEAQLFGFTDDYEKTETSKTLRRQWVKIEVLSSSQAYEGIESKFTVFNESSGYFYGYTTWEIQTGYIAATTTVSLRLKITIEAISGVEGEDSGRSGAYILGAFAQGAKNWADGERYFGTWKQEFEMTYSFVLEPYVKITSNYPNPTGNGQLDKEFVDDGATFAGTILGNFFQSNAVFSNDSRIKVNKTVDGSIIGDFDYTHLSILVTKIQNASLMYSSTEYYKLNSAIEYNTSLGFIFKRGVYNETSGKYLDNGNDAIIEFTFTYKAVSQTYIVYILDKSIDVRINGVSNNASSGTYGAETVNYETIYVDKTNTKNILAGERLVYVEMGDAMQTYANEYYLVFKNQRNYQVTDTVTGKVTDHTWISYHASYPITFSAKDQGNQLYFDLGYSMKGYEFVGAYLASAFESAGFKINASYETTLEESVNFEGVITLSSGTSLITNENLAELTNFANNLFEDGSVVLANRIQMVYGHDENGKDILVDCEKYIVDVLDLSTSDHAVGAIAREMKISVFDRNDGSEDETAKVNISTYYYFKPEIDIAVTHQATDAGNFVELEVNKEYLSMANIFGVYHPTTNKVISPSDFATGTTTLSFETLKYTSGDNAIINNYLNKYGISGGFKITVDGDGETGKNKYLHFASVENSSTYICDYALLPLGAKNDGNFVLGKITYESAGYTKEFYVVVKVMPDYIVKFGESTENVTIESDNSISNVNNIRVISELTAEKCYETFTLTGENGFLSVKHKNGSSTDRELSTENFDITMPFYAQYEATEYNNRKNFINKIGYKIKPTSTERANENWENEAEKSAARLKSGDALFTNVKEVIFADQYYMIKGVDDYGYTYKVYFVLQAKEISPSVDGKISLYEDGYFDLGVQYQSLSIVNENSDYYINVTQPELVANGDVQLITLQGIQAWLFDKNYADSSTDYNYLSITGDTNKNGKADEGEELIPGYTLNGISLGDQDRQYLELPKIAHVTVESITLYDPKDTSVELATLVSPKDELGELSHFATASVGEAYFNGYANRGPIGKQASSGEDTTNQLWKIPKLEKTDIFMGTNTANIILIIKLCYNDGTTEEYYDCEVNANLVRALNIEYGGGQDKAVTQDGDAITVASQFVPKIGTTDYSPNTTYINDTLEVLVKQNSTATFDMTLYTKKPSDGGTKIKTVSIQPLVNVGRDYARTFYISLSQYFGQNVKANNYVKLTNDKNVDKIYYIWDTYPTGYDSDKEFVIGNVFTKDYIYIENANLLAQKSYYNVTKYYIMNCKIDGVTYSYQVSRDYIVTGRIYKMDKKYPSEIGFVMKDYNSDSTISLVEWNYPDGTYSEGKEVKSLTLNKASYANGIVSLGVVRDQCYSTVGLPDGENSIIKFYIDKTASESSGLQIGHAEIDEKTGAITLGTGFSANQYIKVKLKMAVSGPNRSFADDSDATYHTLGTLNLALEG